MPPKPNALTMRPGKGRDAAPPKRPRKQSGEPGTKPAGTQDASVVEDADRLGGHERDVLREPRGPAWLRGRIGKAFPRVVGGVAPH